MKKQQKRGLYLLLAIVLLIILFSSLVFAYSIGSGDEVHQYVSNQSHFVWISIPNEIENNIELRPYNWSLDSMGYNLDDNENILIASGEEDTEFDATCLSGVVIDIVLLDDPLLSATVVAGWGMSVARPFCYHFFDPDMPEEGNYNIGWNASLTRQYGSSYRRADYLWDENVLPYYTGKDSSGGSHAVDQDQAYYWLGRIAHLVEDSTAKKNE